MDASKGPGVEPLAAWSDGTPRHADEQPPAEAPAPAMPFRERLVALDVFRGATVAAMLFVNNPGDWGHLYAPFDHAEWHGWTPTDLIFPFFLFIVGVAGVFSLERRLEAGVAKGRLARQALVRGLSIVLVGWALTWFPFTLEKLMRLRLPGVLPRIGLVYALGTCLVVLLAVPGRGSSRPGAFAGRGRELVLLAVAVLLAVHTFLLTGTGYDLTREGNVQRAVDVALLKGHLWKKDWDPEGLVGTLSAVATMLTGTLTGWFVRSERPLGRRVFGLLTAGAAAAAAGLLWSRTLPINKNLWTGSYVLLTSGLGCVCLAVCLLFVDILKVRRPFEFFLPFGRNPLLAFVLSGLLAKTLGLVKLHGVSLHAVIYRGAFSWIPDPTLRSHAFGLAIVVLWWAVLVGFDRRGWYWKV